MLPAAEPADHWVLQLRGGGGAGAAAPSQDTQEPGGRGRGLQCAHAQTALQHAGQPWSLCEAGEQKEEIPCL